MSGDGKGSGVSLQGGNQPQTPSEIKPEAGVGTAPEPITRDHLTQLKEELRSDILKEIAPEIDTAAQRWFDKKEQRHEKRVAFYEKTVQKALERAGKQLPEGITVRDLAIQQALEEGAIEEPPSASPSGTPTAPTGLEAQPGDELSDPVSAWAQSRVSHLMAKHGVTVEESDPEWNDIKEDARSVDEYLDSYEAAILAKKTRTSTPPPSGRSPAEIPTGSVGNNAIADNNDPADLIRIWREKREAG